MYLKSYIEGMMEELSKLEVKNTASNITGGERNVPNSLSRRQDLVVKPFDKGWGMCFLNVKVEGERQLSGPHCEGGFDWGNA